MKKKLVTSVLVEKESGEEAYNTVLEMIATYRPMHRMGRVSAVGSRNECSQHSSASSHWSQAPDYDKNVQLRVQQLKVARYLPRSGIDKLAIVELLSLTNGSGASPQSISDTSKQAPISDMNDAAGTTEHLNMEGYQASFSPRDMGPGFSVAMPCSWSYTQHGKYSGHFLTHISLQTYTRDPTIRCR